MTHPILIDSHNRQMRKLRVSLTDHCNYRCFYCMPKDAKFFKRTEMLQPDQYKNIVGQLVDLGIEEIRITGGEPTVSPLFRPIIEAIATTNPKKMGLTSNGELLEPHLAFLKSHNVTHLNLSLDSLNPKRFGSITHGGHLDKVLSCLRRAVELGFNVKINCVVVGGVNDDEIIDFVKFSERENTEVRFLEYMKIGPNYQDISTHMISQDQMIEWISVYSHLTPIEVAIDSTSQVFKTHKGARIGFISSESKPFCNQCSRLRLTSKGALRGCLFKKDELSLIDKSGPELHQILREVLTFKPYYRIDHFEESMHITGG